jgi:dTMP kinase
VYDFWVSRSYQNRHGIFITFEGLDGCGKSTQMEKLAQALRAEGHDVVTTREPGGTPTGEKIRSVLLDSGTRQLSPLAELALMFAARAQHMEELIVPALESGKIVLSDRFTDSSEAYQGGGRELGSDTVLALHELLCGGLQPDLTILMDSDVAASVTRARRRNLAASTNGQDENRFERESQAFFARVHTTYHAIAKREPERVTVVNARRPIPTVHAEILRAATELLAKRRASGSKKAPARA